MRALQKKEKEKKKKAYSTWYSQAVSHPSTNQAQPCLASEIGRDRACSGWYGRKRQHRRLEWLKYTAGGRARSGITKKLTAPGIPRRSPIQVLTRPNPAWLPRSDEIGRVQGGVAVSNYGHIRAPLQHVEGTGGSPTARERHGQRMGSSRQSVKWSSLLGLLAKIKCSICSYQFNI